ncbi:hypothetical protein DL766_000243 [Monosporascus sp. MC13-8B]|uniref:Monooxygenase n=1 Tax=Monosporascus cannonballus TaxID=155416 RepID=A0ABY0H4P2_9PEZI|nr:hypothetical protein DL762_005505 [Monosporascus cannonballus]RYO93089.1 hypothetical protein DL763_004485 [Monosporascus cannonballus]RYP39801.1 hypothetical protein DL766_000243 [Monosporascus sp. MC13-8B]
MTNRATPILQHETHADYTRSPKGHKLRPLAHGKQIFWANAGLGCGSVPNFWNVFHAGDRTVHRNEPEPMTDKTAKLQNGTELKPDYMILCTGFDKNYEPFGDGLQRDLGLKYDPTDGISGQSSRPARLKGWTSCCPFFGIPEFGFAVLSRLVLGQSQARRRELLYGPSRYYGPMVAPAFAAEGDRFIIFLDFMHNIYTPLAGEVQALWGVASCSAYQ